MTYPVFVLEMAENDEFCGRSLITGFSNMDVAVEYARRRTRASVEELRKGNPTAVDLRLAWIAQGEDAHVLHVDRCYIGASELDYFIDNQATAHECDWRLLDPVLGPVAGSACVSRRSAGTGDHMKNRAPGQSKGDTR